MPRSSRLSWQVPLAGSVLTLVNGVGWSVANLDIRPQVQWIGLGALIAFAVTGGLITARAFRALRAGGMRAAVRHAIAGLILNLVLISVGVIGLWAAYAHHHSAVNSYTRTARDFQRTLAHEARMPVWIDTDPACGRGVIRDPDDCWALLAALHSRQLAIQGISTVFGNLDGDQTYAVAREAIERFSTARSSAEPPPQLFAGALASGAGAWEPTPASEALADRLRQQRLTILALGPLTNIATVAVRHPDVSGNIERIIMVGGKPPGRLLHPGTPWSFHFRDLNVSKDTQAVDVVLRSGIPLVLVPFDAAAKIAISQPDLDGLAAGDAGARWLSDVSRPWASFWTNMLHRDGFYPFDALAVMYLTAPNAFRCHVRKARMGFSVFLEPFGMGHDLEIAEAITGTQVGYCVDVRDDMKKQLLECLMPDKTRSVQPGEVAAPGALSASASTPG